jgi:hypothetical protein
MIDFWHWILNFTGVNLGQDAFATHMYNFWSGFGSDITEFALVGTLIAIYKHHLKNSKILNSRLLNILHKKDES